MAIKKLTVRDFKKGETITDSIGNVFVTRKGAARVLGTSLVTLSISYIKKGLRPLARRIGHFRVYLLEDVVDFYAKRD